MAATILANRSIQWFLAYINLRFIISVIKRDENRVFHTPSSFYAPVMGSASIAVPSGMEKLEWCGYTQWCKKFEDMRNRFDRIPACDRRHSPRYA